MAQLQSWQDLYKELAQTIINQIPEVKWVDLWSNQINYLTDEHPFPTPAIFISFRMTQPEDIGDNIQEAGVQVDFYYFSESFADTFQGSYNQDSALQYLDVLTKIHQTFHGTSGDNYSSMSRVDLSPVESFTGNFYRIAFSCKITDISASNVREQVTPGDINLAEGNKPDNNEPPIFDISLG